MTNYKEQIETNRILYVQNLENTLRWIRSLALTHYFGDAFDPEHMRSIANMAADALMEWQGGELKTMPDFDGCAEEAKLKAAEWAELWHSELREDYVTSPDDTDGVPPDEGNSSR